ncbi:hypothetical protein ES705_24793 [subsurface metagenome]
MKGLTIAKFKELWQTEKSYISLELTDEQIKEFIERSNSESQALDLASDYLLASGSAEDEE